MGPEIVFIPSAFKHGFSEADIRWAVRTLIGEFLVDEYEDTYAIIGFDTKGNALEMKNMPHMTNEEYDALDELLTKTTPRLTKITGPLTRQRQLLDALDEVSANYIMSKAEAFHKTPSEIIGEMVREKIAVNL